MKSIFLLLVLPLALSQVTRSQAGKSIVVLDPYIFRYDDSLASEFMDSLAPVEYSAAEKEAMLKEISDKKGNDFKMETALLEYRMKVAPYTGLSLGLYGMLTYAVSGILEDQLTIPSHDTCSGNTKALKAVAKKHNVNWVVNTLMLHVYLKDGKKISKARIQVYNSRQNKIVLDKEYTGDSKNPGFELSCEEGSLNCTFNNIINQSVHDVMLAIFGSYQH